MLGRAMPAKGWQGGLACSALIGPAVNLPVDLAASVPDGERLPLALAVWAFIGAAIWMSHRWGSRSRTSAPVAFKGALRADT